MTHDQGLDRLREPYIQDQNLINVRNVRYWGIEVTFGGSGGGGGELVRELTLF